MLRVSLAVVFEQEYFHFFFECLEVLAGPVENPQLVVFGVPPSLPLSS